MPVARTCSECGISLAGYKPQAKTHDANCRQKRARRLRAATKAEKREDHQRSLTPPAIRQLQQMAEHQQQDAVKDVVRDELRPIVRDALTQSTLVAIQDLLGLTPVAVAALKEDLDSEDAVIRQRAYSLQLKYTVGHPALVRPDDSAGGGQMVVNFLGLPRPNDVVDATQIVDSVEVRVCDMCAETKPADEFVGESERCQACQDEWKQKVLEHRKQMP